MVDAEQAVIGKVMRRLIPFCMVCYLLNYLDRVNVSVAQLKMVETAGVAGTVKGFTPGVYSAGVAAFFLAYFLFELPSNLIMQRVGARRWIARIMISWGVVSVGFMFTQGPWSFYTLRFLLGVAEAGFFPGVILYLSYWVPHRHRARSAALFLTSTAISGVIGNPLGGYILYVTEQHPLWFKSWQWLFLIEGVPAVIMGVATWLFLTDRPADAKWLTAEERGLLTELLERERAEHPASHSGELRHAFSSRHTWGLSALYFLLIWGFYTINFYTTKIMRQALEHGGTIVTAAAATTQRAATPEHLVYLWVGLVSAIPFSLAAVGMVLIGRHSDKHNERKYHLVFAAALIVIGLVTAGLAQSLAGGSTATLLTIAGLSVGAVGGFGMFGPFWALPPQLLTGTAAAAAFAIVNSIGNMSGFFGPLCYDHMSMQNNLFVAAGMGAVAGILIMAAPIPKYQPAARLEMAGSGN